MKKYFANLIYIFLSLLTSGILVWGSPSQSAAIRGVVLPLTKINKKVTPTRSIKLFAPTTAPIFYEPISQINLEYHAKPNEQMKLQIMRKAQHNAMRLGANGLIIEALFYDQDFKAYHLVSRAIHYYNA